MTSTVLDVYCGAGGWDEGVRLAGLAAPVIGIDSWWPACATGAAAGHLRICADAATYPAVVIGRETARRNGQVGLVMSPPCQPWSSAGKRLGETDQKRVYDLVDRFASGDPSAENAWAEWSWADPRSHHAAQPARWVRDVQPDWVCLEQVPAVLPLWHHIGRVLTGWGYKVWCGPLNSADFGVPQTRVRAFLIASRSHPVTPPHATHYDPRRGVAMFGDPWVSMATALGWGAACRPAPTVTGGGTGSGGGVEVFAGREARDIAYRNGLRERAAVRPLTDPAPTVHFGESPNEVTWELISAHREKLNDRTLPRSVHEPAPTIAFGHSDMRWVMRTNTKSEQGGGALVPYERDGAQPSPTVRSTTSRWFGGPAAPVEPSGEDGREHSARVTVAEAATLQGFRPDYPWRGTRTQQYTLVGNAVPPLLAAAAVRSALGHRS